MCPKFRKRFKSAVIPMFASLCILNACTTFESNDTKRARLLQEGVDTGEPGALYDQAVLFENGIGVQKDLLKALVFLPKLQMPVILIAITS